jgi:hypothetical protein
MEHPTAECGTATGGSRPTAAIGKFYRRSEDTKLPTFRLAVVHTLKCRFYCDDSRIGWHTYLITADFTDSTYKQQAILFADGPMEDLPAVVINVPLNIEPPNRRFILVKEYDGKSSYLDADKKWKPSPFQKIEDCTVFTCSLLEAREKAFLAMSLVTDPNEKPRIYPVELIDSANEEGGIFFRPLK